MDGQSRPLGVVVTCEDPNCPGSLKMNYFPPQGARIGTLERPFFNHDLVGHAFCPGIKLFNVYAQEFAQCARITPQHHMIILIYNPAKVCRQQYATTLDELLQLLRYPR